MPASKTRDWEEIKRKSIILFNEGKRNYQICKEVGINSHLLQRWLDEIYPDRVYKASNKLYEFNENYFEKIDSIDKAYFLGLIYADGNVYKKRNRLQIFLQNKDKYILELLAKYINYKGNLYNDRSRGFKIILDSRIMFENLIKLGVVPNKTFIIRFPNEEILPKNLVSHFIRGFMDGDGGVAIINNKYLNISITANEAFIKDIKLILNSKGIYSSDYKKRYKNKKISSGSTYINRRESYKKLYNYLYKDCENLFMTRKKDKFDKVINNMIIKRKSRYESSML